VLDKLFQRCARALPPDLVGPALRLPQLLKLAPTGVSVGDTFKHDLTLGAPRFFGGAVSATTEQQEYAVMAHMLAVLEAFGCDRIADHQIEDDGTVARLLGELRGLRDELAHRVDHDAPEAFRAADRESRAAIVEEHAILRAAEPTDEGRYVAVSFGKQAVGFPATLALFPTVALGRQRELAREALRGVWLGLQFHDDVIDWEDDWERDGAWAVCLACHLLSERIAPGASLAEARELVLASGALETMLDLSRAELERAAAAAQRLGTHRLVAWARAQCREVSEVLEQERSSPGYAVRAHRLRFAMETMSA
jgi:hypothetical protein